MLVHRFFSWSDVITLFLSNRILLDPELKAENEEKPFGIIRHYNIQNSEICQFEIFDIFPFCDS